MPAGPPGLPRGSVDFARFGHAAPAVASRLAVPVVEVGVEPVHAGEPAALRRDARVRQHLAGVGVLADLGRSFVLIDRYFSGASDVLIIWCG